MMNLEHFCRMIVLSAACVAVLMCGRVAAAQETTVVFEGTVHAPDGTLADGAVVVTSAGGRAVTDEHGRYLLEAAVSRDAKSVQVTAVGGSGGKLIASTRVPSGAAAGPIIVAPIQLAQASGCSSSWLPTFGGQPGTDGNIDALTVFDDGSGPSLFAAGTFGFAGGVPVVRVAKWNGTSWSALGSGLAGWGADGGVNSLIVFDDGGGPALYAGGRFSNISAGTAFFIAKWDGSSWSALGSGLAPSPFAGSRVDAFAVYDDGTGPALFAGGSFRVPGVTAASNLAKWNGTTWSALGAGVSGFVRSLAVYDDGTGACLYVGGDLLTVGGVAASNVAKWDGANWTPSLGFINSVTSMIVFDDGTGDALFVGGQFNSAGGAGAQNVAKWDGSSWSGLGTGLNGVVNVLGVFDDGNGTRLYAGGYFSAAGGIPAEKVAAWDGASWSSLGAGVTDPDVFATADALTVFDDGSGPALHVGGTFSMADGLDANNLAKWSGSSWSRIGVGLSDSVYAVTVFDDGNGKRLIAGGDFAFANGADSKWIAQWDGLAWTQLGSGLNGGVRALRVHDDGSGQELFVGGDFTMAGGASARHIAKWDGATWTPLGPGLNARVCALVAFDDGGGEELVAAGEFNGTSGLLAPRIAKWDGSSWSGLGTGADGEIFSLAVYDEGAGDRLFAGGNFSTIGGISTTDIARWDGTSWSPVGGGMTGPGVFALIAFDDGSGQELVAGGNFGVVGSPTTNNLARWNGLSWSSLGTSPDNLVSALTVFDDGTGDRLFAGGNFVSVDGIAANRIAKWNGSDWFALGSGLGRVGVLALTGFDDGAGRALYAGGSFRGALDSGDSYLAEWRCESIQPPNLTGDHCNGDGGDQLGCTNCPCSNNSPVGTIGGCLNSALTSACLVASGDPAVNLGPGVATDLRFSLTNAPSAAFCILNSGDALAPTSLANPCFGLDSGTQATQFDGLRCAVTNTRRHGGRSADVNGDVGVTNSPWGGEGGPPAGIANAGSGFVAGQTRFFQVIHRDDPLAQCMRGLNTSQAVSVRFTP